LAVFVRKKYGANKINYKLFPDKNIKSFEAFLLKNGGDDWNSTLFKDAMIHKFTEKITDGQASRPSILFINGEYWGIHNLREKLNEHYLSSHYKIDPNSVNLIKLESSPYLLSLVNPSFDYNSSSFLDVSPQIKEGVADNYFSITSFLFENNIANQKTIII